MCIPTRLSQFKRMFGFICSKDDTFCQTTCYGKRHHDIHSLPEDDSHCSSTLILAFSSQVISQFHFSSLMLIVIFCFVCFLDYSHIKWQNKNGHHRVLWFKRITRMLGFSNRTGYITAIWKAATRTLHVGFLTTLKTGTQGQHIKFAVFRYS